MGCDIHVYREVKRNGQWESLDESYEENEGTDDEPEMITYLSNPYMPRNYWLFGLFCSGVRTEWPFSFTERGLPDDVSAEVQGQSDRWDSDGHSHSWLTVEELRHKSTELTIHPDKHAVEFPSMVKEVLDRLEWPENSAPQDCRIVFWFDN